MATPFSRTLSFLEADQRAPLGRIAAVVIFLFAGCLAWMTFSTTTIYAVSDEGRLLAAGAASPIQSPVAGVIAETRLVLGARVKAGDELVLLDASSELLRRDEEQARLAGVTTALEALEAIVSAERSLADATARAGASRVGSAAARARAASAIAVLAKQRDTAVKVLRDESLVSGLEALATTENMQRERGQVTIQRADTVLASADLERQRREATVRLLTLEKDVSELTARRAGTAAVLATLDWEIARRTLRAPIDGIVADIGQLSKGVIVGPNLVLATIVPPAKMRWVATFAPREAVGRIKPGQRARLRLDAFPWTAYGSLDAAVVSVGSEPRAQRVRVELDLVGQNPNIALAHGMTGIADIEVERLSPLRLLLRLAGQSVQGEPASRATPLPALDDARAEATSP